LVDARTLKHVSGPTFCINPHIGILTHVRDNPGIAKGISPNRWIPGRVWVEFTLKRNVKKTAGVEVFDAQFI